MSDINKFTIGKNASMKKELNSLNLYGKNENCSLHISII